MKDILAVDGKLVGIWYEGADSDGNITLDLQYSIGESSQTMRIVISGLANKDLQWRLGDSIRINLTKFYEE